MFSEAILVLVWLLANGVYIDLKRKGVRSFGRVCAFLVGLPATWAWLFLVPEGGRPSIQPPPDDEEALLEEVRRDRALRADADQLDREEPTSDAD